jgi:hypothetical protein
MKRVTLTVKFKSANETVWIDYNPVSNKKKKYVLLTPRKMNSHWEIMHLIF